MTPRRKRLFAILGILAGVGVATAVAIKHAVSRVVHDVHPVLKPCLSGARERPQQRR